MTARVADRRASRHRVAARRTMPEQVASGIYVYAIVAADDFPDQACTGLDDAPLELMELGPLAAVVSVVRSDRPVSVRVDLMAHTRVLGWLAERTTVIPVAFGTMVDDRDTVVTDVLEPGAEVYVDMLSRLQGTSQYNLRGLYVRERVLSEVVLADPGLAELHRRTRDLPQDQPHPALIRLGEGVSAALERSRALDSDRILSAVAPHVTDLRGRAGGDMDQVFNVAMLVPETHRLAVESTLEEIAEVEHERLRLQLTGPFPAYDFVGGSSWAS
jgi:gas vesicle protein GvpL/GvpF